MDIENAAPQAASVTSVLAAVKASPQPDLESLVRTDGDELAKMLECTELPPYADAIRANANNPAEDGRYYPLDGAPEWHVGAGSMANDPRDRRLNNAHLTYVKPEVGSRAVRDLALMRPVLVATRDIQPDEVRAHIHIHIMHA